MSTETLPQPSQQFTKNGITVTVHHVNAEQVYYVKYREGCDGKEWDSERDCPRGYLGSCRMPVEKFMEQAL